jgi:hypothetical protein
LHVRVEHLRLKVELVQAIECVASVALHDGNDQALLAGQHGVPELWQEREDVVGERLQLKHLPPSRKLQFLWCQKARLVGADNEVLHHVVEKETTSGVFARRMRVAAAQLGVQFANELFKKRQKY